MGASKSRALDSDIDLFMSSMSKCPEPKCPKPNCPKCRQCPPQRNCNEPYEFCDGLKIRLMKDTARMKQLFLVDDPNYIDKTKIEQKRSLMNAFICLNALRGFYDREQFRDLSSQQLDNLLEDIVRIKNVVEQRLDRIKTLERRREEDRMSGMRSSLPTIDFPEKKELFASSMNKNQRCCPCPPPTAETKPLPTPTPETKPTPTPETKPQPQPKCPEPNCPEPNCPDCPDCPPQQRCYDPSEFCESVMNRFNDAQSIIQLLDSMRAKYTNIGVFFGTSRRDINKSLVAELKKDKNFVKNLMMCLGHFRYQRTSDMLRDRGFGIERSEIIRIQGLVRNLYDFLYVMDSQISRMISR
jgi:hypothetical protein